MQLPYIMSCQLWFKIEISLKWARLAENGLFLSFLIHRAKPSEIYLFLKLHLFLDEMFVKFEIILTYS